MCRRPAVLSALALLLSCGVCLAAPSAAVGPPAGAVPVIDGEVAGDPAWAAAAALGDFRLLGKPTLAGQATQVRVLAAPETLYVAFTCREDRLADLVARVTQPDGPVWEDDCVEVFLAPFSDRSRYYHFLVNARGVLRDELRREGAFASGAQAGAKRGEGFWSAELAVPLSSLDLDETVGTTWGANFCRAERPHGETSSWAPCSAGFHEPASFGELTGLAVDLARLLPSSLRRRAGETLAAVAALEAAVQPYPALAEARGLLASCRRARAELGGATRRLAAPLSLDQAQALGADLARLQRQLALRQKRAERLPMVAAAGEAGYVVCAESPLVKVRPDEPYRGNPRRPLAITLARNEYEPAQLVVVPVAADLQQVTVQVGPVVGPGGATLPLQTNRVGYVTVKESSGRAVYPPGRFPDPLLPNGPAEVAKDTVQSWWLTAHAAADQPAGLYRAEVLVAAANAPATRLPLEVRVWNFALPTTSRLRSAYGLNLGSIYSKYDLATAPGRPPGWEFGQWVGADMSGLPDYYGTMAFTTAFDTVEKHHGKRSCRVAVTAVTPGVRETPRVAYISHQRDLKAETDYELTAWYRTAEGDQVGPAIFLSKVAEQRLPPTGGQWRQATVRFNTGGNTDQYVYFKVDRVGTVWWDELCLAPRGADAAANVLPNPSFERGEEGGSERIRDAYFHNALAHRASPTNLVSPRITTAPDGTVSLDWSEFDRLMADYLARGLSAFNVNWCQLPGGWGSVETVQDQQRLARAKQLLRLTQEHLEEKGWTKYAYLYTIDEPGYAAFAQVKQAFALAHGQAPKLKRLLTYGYGASKPIEPGQPRYADLAGFVDIHVPHSDCVEPVYLQQRREAGDEIWCYVCISAQRPYLNVWGIDYPALDHRLLYWQLFRERIKGFLYWECCYWQVDPWQDTLTYPGGNADGSLLYPGPEGPVDSIRWELVRDGTEDYDLLTLLKEAAAGAGAEETLLQFPQLTRSWTQYSEDPAVLEALRLQVGTRLEALRRRP